jgi:hypothetical protein
MKWTKGYELFDRPLPLKAPELAMSENWPALDELMQATVHTELKLFLHQFKKFDSIEHMLAIRNGDDLEEEDGIWHDDSSRVLAFSWSMNFWGLPTGGTLGIREFGKKEIELGPYPPGTLIVFNTGIDGFEHRTSRVQKGRRLVCAGWCSLEK